MGHPVLLYYYYKLPLKLSVVTQQAQSKMNTIKIVLSLLVVVAAASAFDLTTLDVCDLTTLHNIGLKCYYQDCSEQSGAAEACAKEQLSEDEFAKLKTNSFDWFMECPYTGRPGSLTDCFKARVNAEFSNSNISACDDEYDALATPLQGCFARGVAANHDLFLRLWSLLG